MAGEAASAGWVEPHGGRVVPVYAVTGGRTRANDGPDMPIEALVTTTEAGVAATDLQLEYRMTVERVLVSDLVNAKYLVVHLPPVSTTADGSPAREILERLLEGLRAR